MMKLLSLIILICLYTWLMFTYGCSHLPKYEKDFLDDFYPRGKYDALTPQSIVKSPPKAEDKEPEYYTALTFIYLFDKGEIDRAREYLDWRDFSLAGHSHTRVGYWVRHLRSKMKDRRGLGTILELDDTDFNVALYYLMMYENERIKEANVYLKEYAKDDKNRIDNVKFWIKAFKESA